MKASDLEEQFAGLWRMLDRGVLGPLPPFEREYRFAPPRKWRFDFAWPLAKVAVEIEGAIYTGGRHTRGAGFQRDLEKLNAATALGWRVLRYTGIDLKLRGYDVVEAVRAEIYSHAQQLPNTGERA